MLACSWDHFCIIRKGQIVVRLSKQVNSLSVKRSLGGAVAWCGEKKALRSISYGGKEKADNWEPCVPAKEKKVLNHGEYKVARPPIFTGPTTPRRLQFKGLGKKGTN